jgi:hypothetical protein
VLTATQYVILAVPIGIQAQDLQCQGMTMNQSGQSGAVDNLGANSTVACWGTN